MSKTPEEMAKEYVKQEQLEYEESIGVYYGFLAGYKAAQPHWISVKEVIIDGKTYRLVES